MASIVYKKKAYGGNTSIANANHVIANNGSGTNESLQNLLIKILGNFATIQSSTKALKAYNVGEYFILNSYLYKVKNAIAAGDTINVGTNGNAVQTTVETEIQTTVPEELNKVLPTMVGEQIDNKFGDDIGDDVTSWLTEHVNPAGSAVVVDDTLTIEGAAADAKKTGDEISGLKEDINDLGLSVVDGKLSITYEEVTT